MNDQEARDHIAEQIKQYGPPASISDALQEKEWQKQFGQPHVIVDIEAVLGCLRPTPARTSSAGQEMYHSVNRHAYCLLCIEEMEHRGIKTYRLHVRWEDDPLKNIACLIHLACFHCDFEQYVGVEQDPRIPQGQQAQGDMFSPGQQIGNYPDPNQWGTTTTTTTDITSIAAGQGLSSGSSITSISGDLGTAVGNSPFGSGSGSWWPWK